MKRINWLHISDLHFKQSDNYNQKVVVNSLLKDIKESLIKDNKKIDLIFITGDLTYSGKIEEFAIFDEFLEELIKVTNVAKKHIIVVPGNHDVNLNDVSFLLKQASGAINDCNQVAEILGSVEERKNFLVGLKNYNEYITKTFPWAISQKENPLSYTINLEINSIKVSLLALNTAWLALPTSKKGEIVLGERQVREALEDIDNPNIVVSLMHHSFEWLKWFDKKDVKGMLDNRADFILSGHEHIEDIFQKISNMSETFYISAGSLYDNRTYTNTYNVVELDLVAGVCNIEIHQYNDRHGGYWTKISNLPNGNEYKLPNRLVETPVITLEKIREDEDYQSLKSEKGIELPKIPNDLINKIIEGNCLLFAGAGASIDAGLPTWHDFLITLIEKTQDMEQFSEKEVAEIKSLLGNGEFLIVAEICRKKLGIYEFSNIIKKTLAVKGRNSSTQKILSEIPFSGCLTTNYDSFVESNKLNSRVILPKELNEISFNELNSILENNYPVIKLHGTYDNVKSIILTHQDYNSLIFNGQNSRYRENLKYILSNKSIFFLGFSFRDPNIDFMLQEIFSSYNGSSIPHYAVIPDIGELKSAFFWENYNIKVISLPVRELGWKCFIEFLAKIKIETLKNQYIKS